LDCGGSTPPWNNFDDEDKSHHPARLRLREEKCKGGVEPPQSKALRAGLKGD
jgi:hypothetical protein